MAISASDVKALRDRTGMGMMECKAALEEANGDSAAAVEILRKRAKGKMDERTDRQAIEGTLAVAKAADGSAIALVELNSETDFTARNDSFVAAAKKVAELALAGPAGEVAKTDAITDAVDAVRLTTKENCSFSRGVKLAAAAGQRVGSYVHHDRKKAAIILVDGDAPEDLLVGLCQHVVANVPVPAAVDESDIDPQMLAKVRSEFIEEAKASGKPAEIAEKMAVGRIQKWIDERTLMGQIYIRELDSKTKIKDALPKGVKVRRFVRYEIGVAG